MASLSGHSIAGVLSSRRLLECGNGDVTATGCSHPISSAAAANTSPRPPPAARQAHFNTPHSFDRLYGLIILNIYGSHFPKPSMFIQHLGDHSTAPFIPPITHTHLSLLSPPPPSCFPPVAQTLEGCVACEAERFKQT